MSEVVDEAALLTDGESAGARIVIGPDDPNADDVRRLLARHLEFSHTHSPAEAVFALDTSGLTKPGVSFFGARQDGRLLGVGALRRIDKRLAEIKSMHTAAAARGQGVGRRMLDHLISVARSAGYDRVNLETGPMDAYAPARALYASAGFLPTGPFGDYRPSPYSCFMTLPLF